MGVPKFFRYISERYPCLSELVRENQVPEFDNLYLDMNGIIHSCSHPNDNDVHFRITEEQIFKDIFFYLETLFNMIKPQKLFFLAVDGVAPRAKMNQQRGRRFRSAKEAEIQEEKAKQKGEQLPDEARFDSNCITPGTPFMCRLDKALRYFIQYKISTSKSWQNCKVILSGHQTPGEGEHKIMEYIRYLKTQKKFDPNTRHCLYGLDADLIMLGLCTHERHFSLLREEVKFGKKNNKAVSVSQQRFFLLHLSLLREYLEQEFITLKENLKFAFDIEKVIDDWVLMGFLVGNDFIPNIPNLHINANALPILYQTYIKTLPSLDGYINEGGTLNLSRLQKYIENLDQFDRDNFSAQYEDLKFLETKHQSGFNNRNTDTFGGNQDLMDLVKATEFEFDSPEEDGDDVFDSNEDENGDVDDDQIFEKEFHQHRRDYYVNKMKYQEMTPEVLIEQTQCYITALQWTLHYYYHGVKSWGYFYPHHYAPFISDLKNFKDFKPKFELGKPFLPFEQLMSVLPAASRDHVPECYKELMTNPESELIDFYPTNFETDLNGKKQDWEAVVLIPFIEEERLLKTLKKYDEKLTSDEKIRNIHGPMFIYTYSSTNQGSLEGPPNFPSIGNLMCKEQKTYREEIQVPEDKLVLGPSKGSMQNVYYVGFPTLKHLSYKSDMRLQHVKVFDQPSRGENMIIVVERPEEEKPIDVVVKEMMGKVVYVGWPHLMEAKIIRISDKDNTYFSDGKSDKTNPQKWKLDVQAIKDHHMHRMGIDIGEVTRIVNVLQATGYEYKFDQGSKIYRNVKTWNKVEGAYPMQTIVSDIKTYRKKMKEELPIFEAFKTGTDVFMLGNKYYGSRGEVVDTSCFEKGGRIKVSLTVHEEPKFDGVWDMHIRSQDSYLNSYQAASRLSISENVFNRITGTVLVIAGIKRQIAEGTSKMNIGLQLKFNKQNEELTGYTKKERMWLYSEKTVNLVQEYYCKFPQIFEVMGRRSNNNKDDVYYESDFFEKTEGEDCLHSLLKWLGQLPHNKAERRTIGTESVEKDVIDELKKQAAEANKLPMKRSVMQVKPHLVYTPFLSAGTSKSPDEQADFQLFDRVVVVRNSEQNSIGDRGTVIGINRVKDLNPVRQDCINKEDVYCEILFDEMKQNNGVARVAVENLLSISYGLTRDGVPRISNGQYSRGQQKYQQNDAKSSEPPKLTENFSTILQNPNRNQKNGPQKNSTFTDFWNAAKNKSGPPPPSDPIPIPSNQNAPTKSQYATKSLDLQKKANDALNKKMSELTIKKKTSPPLNDQSVPIMMTPPTKLPTPPIEWLMNGAMEPNVIKQETIPRPPPQQQQQQVNPIPINNVPLQFHQKPRLKLEMPQQSHPPMPLFVNAIRPQPAHPFAMNPSKFQPVHPQMLMNVRVPPPMNIHPPQPLINAPFFANNQPRPHIQQQQRFFHNSDNNGKQHQGKFKPQQPPIQSVPQSAPVQSGQNNPFIPLQAARKTANRQQTPSKETTPVSDAKVGEKEVNSAQKVKNDATTTATDTNAAVEEKKEAQKPLSNAKTPDPRKSRLAIKF